MFSLSELISKIRDIFYKLRNPVIFSLEEEYAEIISKSDEIKLRNVVVGTVRRREQLPVNLENKFYHMPMIQLISAEGLEYVALYQSRNLFNLETDTNGVTYFGKITDTIMLKRCEIEEIPRNTREPYARFEVSSWNRLFPEIKIREKVPKVFIRTSYYLLMNGRYTSDLFCKNVDEYLVHLGLQDILSDVYDGFTFKNITVIKKVSKFIVKIGNKKLKYPVREIQRKTLEIALEILRLSEKTLDK
jgi:hypothetical protein